MKRDSYFSYIVEKIGNNQAYFPGTGGNVSFKIGDVMFIKASGKRVLNMNEDDGVISLSHKPVTQFFFETPKSEEGESISNDLIRKLVHEGQLGRPSIETGFHTLLGSVVIHSHSAYVALFACTLQFQNVVETIFFGTPYKYICLPYAKPGYHLTHTLLDAVRNISGKPRVFFMQNHGLIVSAQTEEDAVLLHEEVNQKIRDYFSLSVNDYPKAELFHLEGDISESGTQFLIDFVASHIHLFASIEEHIIFPDLSVFCDDIEIVDSFSECVHKVTIERITGKVRYKTNEQEAQCIEENLVAYAFIMSYMKKHHLSPFYISKNEVGHIRDMEQEKYRKFLLQK
ncbi:MAG: hypothetical protein RLZZ308_133 [Candidatus Parcubacteria bacterium]|jgi:ribulose-5-phosphate 4-epimerase/fuculose-1-phosphate aldolase